MTSTVTDKVRKIKASLNFARMSDNDLLKRLDAIHVGMTDNAAFPSPLVAMTEFRSAIDAYHTLTTDALDGGKKAISAKRKQREVVIKMATQLGHYAEAASTNDLATFNTSGFDAASVVEVVEHLDQVAAWYLFCTKHTVEDKLVNRPFRTRVA